MDTPLRQLKSQNPARLEYNARVNGINTSILAGNVEMYQPAEGIGATLPATILKNYDMNYAQSIVIETVLGDGSLNSMYEVEASLSKNNVAMPYVYDTGATWHHFLFPTKKMERNCTTARGVYSGFPNVPVSIREMDMEERVPGTAPGPIVSPPPPPGAENTMPWENTFVVPDAFPAGWYNYVFTAPATRGATQSADGDVTYTGAPVIPTVMIWSGKGFSWFYGAWTDGAVSHTIPGPLPNYQYEQ